MLRFSGTELRILQYLYERSEADKTRPYLTEIARDLGTTKAMISNNINKLEKKGLIESEKKGPLKFYKISEMGKALTWGLLNPDALADLYEEEETVRSIGARSPLLLDFVGDIQSLWDMEAKLLEKVGRENRVPTDWSKGISKIRKEKSRLDKKFQSTKDEMRREMGRVEIPYIAGFTSIESLEDLELIASFEEESKFSKEATSVFDRIASIKKGRDDLELTIEGLKSLHKNSLMEKKEFAELKARYERKLKIINEFLENVKKLIKS